MKTAWVGTVILNVLKVGWRLELQSKLFCSPWSLLSWTRAQIFLWMKLGSNHERKFYIHWLFPHMTGIPPSIRQKVFLPVLTTSPWNGTINSIIILPMRRWGSERFNTWAKVTQLGIRRARIPSPVWLAQNPSSQLVNDWISHLRCL